MFWKILFVLLSLLIIFVNFTFGSLGEASLFHLIAFLVLDIVYAITLGYFFSLGWKKSVYSKTASNVLFTIIVLFIIFLIVQSVHAGLPVLILNLKANLTGHPADSSIYLSAVMLLALTSFVIYSLIWAPAVISHFKYKKHFETFEIVNKRFYFISTLYILLIMSLPLITGLFFKG